MNALVVVRGGYFSTIQDRGRFGHRALGVCAAGALDHVALEIANALAANKATEAVMEITMGQAAFGFTDARRFALAGADFQATLDGEAIPPWSSHCANAGQTLVLGEPVNGVRAVVAIAGGIDVPIVLGSRSTDVRASFGGFEGRLLRAGDRIPLGKSERDRFHGMLRVKPPQWQFDAQTFGVLPAPEYTRFAPSSRKRFWDDRWTVSPQSDRMGLRLQGESLQCDDARATDSHAVFPGVIQVPPSGQPIVLLNDGQTTGGYPKIGVIRKADLWKLAQVEFGTRIRFVESTVVEAQNAQRDLERYVEEVRAAVAARM